MREPHHPREGRGTENASTGVMMMRGHRGSVWRLSLGLFGVLFCLLLRSGGAISSEDLYCGRQTCYEVLGLEQSSTDKEIKQAFRSLSLKYHPDKNKDPDAVDVFRSVANAYTVLTENRVEYDDLLQNPEKFLRHQWRYYRYHYTHHHTPVWKVLLGVAVLATTAHYLYWRSRYFSLRRMMLESPEIQKKLRRERLRREEVLRQEGRLPPSLSVTAVDSEQKKSSGRNSGSVRRRPGKRASKEGRSETTAVKEEETGGGGGTLPSPPLEDHEDPEKVTLDDVARINGWQGRRPVFWKDNLLFQIFLWFPLWAGKQIFWFVRWYVLFTLLQQPYGPEEYAYITAKSLQLSWSRWENLPAEEREELVSRELWKPENMLEWRREMNQIYKRRR